jgi:non-lysosomal glucosylceramidase
MPNRKISFAPMVQSNGVFRSTWSTGSAWGNVIILDGELRLKVLGGNLQLASLGVQGLTISHTDFIRSKSDDTTNTPATDYAEFCSGTSLTVQDERIQVSDKADIASL